MRAARRVARPGLRYGLALALLLLVAAPLQAAWAQEAAADGPESCRLGVSIEDIYTLDVVGDTFGASLWIWSLCPTPDVSALESLVFRTAETGLQLGPVEVTPLAEGGVYASRRVQGTFRHDWNMDHYPFDLQRIVIPMDEAQHGASRLIFEPDDVNSFLNPEIRDRLDEWNISDVALAASVNEQPSAYGLPGDEAARYARIDAVIEFERAHVLTFFKLTAGAFAGAFFAFMIFFYDPNERSGFSGRLGLLVGVLFALLLNLRFADASLGHIGHMTLVTKIHLVTLVLIVLLALVALYDHHRATAGRSIPHPDRGLLFLAGGLYLAATGWMIGRAALA